MNPHARAVVAALALVCALEAIGPAARAQPAAAPEPVQTRTLPNGLTVITVDDDSVAVVETALWFRFGAKDEPGGKAGIAHALARMVERGTPSLSSAGFDDVAARLGARASVTTANDYTRYELTVPADRTALALEIQADAMQHAEFAAPSWNEEKSALLADWDRTLAQPVERLYRDVCRAASTSPLCATAALGQREDIAALTADDLRATYHEFYEPGNATLVIAGDIRAGDAFALAETAFGSIRRADSGQSTAPAPTYAHDARVALSGSAPYDVLDIAYPAPAASEPSAAAFTILDAALSDSRSEVSRALLDSGFATGFSTRLDRGAAGGLYHVFIIVARDHASGPARAAFLAAVARTRERGLGSDLVLTAKTSLVRRAEDAGASLDGIAENVGYAFAVERVAGPGIAVQGIESATLADVSNAARQYLETPAATGILSAGSARDDGQPAPPLASIADDLSRRVPSGPAIEAAWARRAIAKPVALESGLRPLAFALPSGLRVLVEPLRASPTVFVSGTLETSPRFDARGREGVGDMVSTLLAYGGAKYDAAARRGVADTLGASFDFGFAFRAHGRANDLRALLDVLADSLASPAFESDDVERVRADARERIRDPYPDETAATDFARLLLQRNDPGLREPSDASLRAISIEDLHAYARHFLRPDLTTIAIAGDVDTDEVRADVEATFGGWTTAGSVPDVRRPAFAQGHAARRAVPADGDRIDAHLGLPAAARSARDYYALAVLQEVLAARLYPPNSATLQADRFRGLIDVRLSAPRAQFPEAISAFRRESALLQRTAIGASELERAKSKAVADPLIAERTSETIVERVREIGLDRLPLDIETKLPGLFGAVRAQDVLRVARTYLNPNSLIEVDEGPRT